MPFPTKMTQNYDLSMIEKVGKFFYRVAWLTTHFSNI